MEVSFLKDAINRIAAYLGGQLADLVESGNVVVMI